MQVTSAYKARIKKTGYAGAMKDTVRCFCDAVDFLVQRIDLSWEEICRVPTERSRRKNFIEHLFHQTKDNPSPRHGQFDVLFPGMPSYFRRAAMAKAYGIVSSCRSNYENWEEGGKKGNPPVLPRHSHAAPTFYRGNTFLEGEGKDTLRLKLLVGGKWKFVNIPMRHSDMEYIRRKWSGKKENCPALSRANGY